jgi:dipeptidyl aminopeptidase/acylaminoacyl peptidase
LDWIGVIEHAVGGFTPYEKPETYEKFNPINHVANWSQPMLIIHSGRDYRVPDIQGISAFTALQRRGIPSRMLYFPREGRAISNPLNSLDRHQEVFDWMNKWIA